MLSRLAFLTASVIALTGGAHASFVGELKFVPSGCEAVKACTLKSDFGYIDPDKIGWQAKAGDKTDGASIPLWAQKFVGGQFKKEFIKAAVIHDHYCDRHVRPWRQTHRVFYSALVESGVNKLKAKLMYGAVVIGGPKWTEAEIKPGKPCSLGSICVFSMPLQNLPKDGSLTSGENGSLYITRAARFERPEFQKDFGQLAAFIGAGGDGPALEDIDARANELMAEDFFFQNGSSISGTSNEQ
jgi:Protein of unknown function (DUF1353)